MTYEYKWITANSLEAIVNRFNELGKDGWKLFKFEFISTDWYEAVMERAILNSSFPTKIAK